MHERTGYNWCYIRSGSRCKQSIPSLLVAGGGADHRKKFCSPNLPFAMGHSQWTGSYEAGQLALHVDSARDGVLQGHVDITSVLGGTASYRMGGAWTVTGSNPGNSKRWTMELPPTSPITRSISDGYTKVGKGYCNKGCYKRESVAGMSLATCQAKCDAEAQCNFISFLEGKSCARCSSSWQQCVGSGGLKSYYAYVTYTKNSGNSQTDRQTDRQTDGRTGR